VEIQSKEKQRSRLYEWSIFCPIGEDFRGGKRLLRFHRLTKLFGSTVPQVINRVAEYLSYEQLNDRDEQNDRNDDENDPQGFFRLLFYWFFTIHEASYRLLRFVGQLIEIRRRI